MKHFPIIPLLLLSAIASASCSAQSEATEQYVYIDPLTTDNYEITPATGLVGYIDVADETMCGERPAFCVTGPIPTANKEAFDVFQTEMVSQGWTAEILGEDHGFYTKYLVIAYDTEGEGWASFFRDGDVAPLSIVSVTRSENGEFTLSGMAFVLTTIN